jgi:hypothetical protein
MRKQTGIGIVSPYLPLSPKRPDHSGATDEEWWAWHEKYKDTIDTKSLMPHRFNRP